MEQSHHIHLLLLLLLITTSLVAPSQASVGNGHTIKSATFLSPKFVLGPGSVENNFFYNIDFPRGHIGLKSFDAEVVDEAGNSVPLYETYLHHWLVERYHAPREKARDPNLSGKDVTYVRNDGFCQNGINRQSNGLGSETRRTSTYVPDPYAIQVGNPAEIPAGYEEGWMLNVHAIDTRGAEDRLGCTECLCELYNTSGVTGFLPNDYRGGLFCCFGHTECRVEQGFVAPRRNLYLRYTVKWVDWDIGVLPVKIYIFDVTDTGKRNGGSTGFGPENGCQIEYDIEPCRAHGWCVDVKRRNFTMPSGGYIVYSVAHQHTGGIGSTLYGKDGRVICHSVPIYGTGNEPGNEDGYIVGMTTCYPKFGSVKLAAGEELILESNYTSTSERGHTGVMGLFYILVADQTSSAFPFLGAPFSIGDYLSLSSWYVVALFGLMAVAIGVGVLSFARKEGAESGYHRVMA
ncbi:unnamed protein product [Linum trigynum]|uniref:Uncharacterized protein n=1 Tax=Linum trigynum TaxID=586398 RepID=A0AAV2F058_9ROSI